MDSQIKELITQLRNKLIIYQGEIDNIQGEFNTLKNQSSLDQAIISKQEKELKDLENKMFECSESRKEIQGELDKKVVELENSNLTKEEISQQVIQLLTKSGFTEVGEKLLKT
jgi:chromosome segregation ATPase